VYSLAWSPDGESLSAGLGDGTIGVFGMHNRSLVQRHGLVGRRSSSDGTVVQTYAHESSVASVVYPCFSASTANRILCSGGSDGNLVVWDLGNLDDDVGEWDDDDANGETNKGELTKVDDDVSKLFSPDLLRELSGESDDASAATTTTTTTTTPKILFEIPHGEKINWVTPATSSSSSSDNDNVDSRRNTFFVADTSPDITSYTMPF
jgi:WD40 repeat protein